jgi:hypothetical protein
LEKIENDKETARSASKEFKMEKKDEAYHGDPVTTYVVSEI